MKQKNTLLIVFFLTLFVFQQVQAGATIPSVERPSQVNPAPANVGILYDTFYVYVYHLVPADQPFAGSILNPGSPIQCEWPTSAYGCGSEPPGSLREPEVFFMLHRIITLEMFSQVK